jgi:acyl transferase domain-containing protein
MMREVAREVHYAAFLFGLIATLKAWKVIPARPEFSGQAVDGGLNHAEIEEWHAGEPEEVVARKVLTATSAAYWLRADLADAVLARVAEEEAALEARKQNIIRWIQEQDEANAARRGMTVEAYRRERNAQGHRSVMRSGVNSIGM